MILPEADELKYSELGVYYDDGGAIYFSPDICFWTAAGELVFTEANENRLDITYRDISEYEEQNMN